MPTTADKRRPSPIMMDGHTFPPDFDIEYYQTRRDHYWETYHPVTMAESTVLHHMAVCDVIVREHIPLPLTKQQMSLSIDKQYQFSRKRRQSFNLANRAIRVRSKALKQLHELMKNRPS